MLIYCEDLQFSLLDTFKESLSSDKMASTNRSISNKGAQ